MTIDVRKRKKLACARRDRSARCRRGFTLIELLAVIAIVTVLAGLLLTAVSRARGEGQRVKCLNNLRQMVQAALAYEMDHGRFPPAYVRDFGSGVTKTWESYLWRMGTDAQVQQCPAFDGDAMWGDDRYAGYNYNASYVGGRVFRNGSTILGGSTHSALMSEIKNPAGCALFGDGEYAAGANKFMRSPHPGRLDADASLALGGTQGFRHRGKTNVGFVDGHAESLDTRYTDTAAPEDPAEGCGFLSPDNSLYDFE